VMADLASRFLVVASPLPLGDSVMAWPGHDGEGMDAR